MPTDTAPGPAIPLARWASRKLQELAALAGSHRIATLDGPTLLGERAAMNGWLVPGLASAGLGGSKLMRTADNRWFALTILRDVDREMLPALFAGDIARVSDAQTIARAVGRHEIAGLLDRGRALGLPVASADEKPLAPPVEIITRGRRRTRTNTHRPLVVDLSAIWAGPLAGHLFWLAGAEVVKVESPGRPDLIRRDDPATFDVINQGKANVALDLADNADREALVALIRRADIVIESSRPRALRHLGIDAEALVREVPGLVWLSVTGHGATGEAANWAGVGNDCSVAAGLSRAMERAGGRMGYVGDAITDPLTGITAALAGWRSYLNGEAVRIGFAMSAIGAQALADESALDAARIATELREWSNAVGKPFPPLPRRTLLAPVAQMGADAARYLSGASTC